MFNKTYNVTNPTQFVTKEVHEHRAPTDESVKLLRELEKAAEDKLISITRLDNNLFRAIWHVFEDSAEPYTGWRVVCQFELNGKTERMDFVVAGRHQILCEKPEMQIAEEIQKRVCERLSRILTVDLFRKPVPWMKEKKI